MKKQPSTKSVIMYHTANGEVSLRPDYKEENIWATQARIAEIFAIDRSVVTKHINNLFK